MPAVRGTYWRHPVTDEPGYWIMLMDGSVVGRTANEIASFIPTGGQPAGRPERFRQTLITALQPLFEETVPLNAEDLAWYTANPEPFCRVENGSYVKRLTVVDVEVYQLSPLRFNVILSNGASGVQTSYG